MMPGEIALIGVPANSSGRADGVARAPAVLRQRGHEGADKIISYITRAVTTARRPQR